MSTYQTPISATKRFKKLRLKRRSVSCPQNQRDNKEKFNRENKNEEHKMQEPEKETGEESASPFYKNEEFNTPPFVTKSRPKYSKNISTPQLSDDFISDTPTSEAKSQINSKYAESTRICEHKTSIRLSLNDMHNSIQYGRKDDTKNASAINYCDTNNFIQYSTPKNNNTKLLSPKSTIIMTKLYGDVWQKTPGLFKATKQTGRSNLDNDCDLLTKQFDSLGLESIHTNSITLKPQRLSFEWEDDEKAHQNTSSNLKFEKNIPKADFISDSDDSSDSIFSAKKVRKKKVFSSSLSNGSNDDALKSKNYLVISDSEKENNSEDEDNKYRRRSIFRVEEDLGCSIVLIETDTGILSDKEKKAIDKKRRKLFSKCNTNFNQVQFVSEQSTNEIIKRNRIYEILDDSVCKESDKSILETNVQNEFIEEVELKPKKDLEIKKVKRKPRVRKKCKENVAPTLPTCDVKLDSTQVYGFMASLSDSLPSWRCNKEAKYFKDNFKSKKSELTQKLFSMFNEKVYSQQIDGKLPITWSATLQTTAGRAFNKLKKSTSGNVKSSSVELSLKVLDTAQRLRDTLAHELCHVASWVIDGQLRDRHGPYWKKWVSKTLDAFPEIGSIPVCHSLSIHYKYTFKCTRCGYGVNRHSKSIDVTKKVCGYCGGRLECIHNKKDKDGLIVSTPVKRSSRELKGFALYVKENYGNVRGSNTPHKQAMQYLGKQYAKMKATKSCSDTDQ